MQQMPTERIVKNGGDISYEEYQTPGNDWVKTPICRAFIILLLST